MKDFYPSEKMSPNTSNGPGSPVLSWDDVQGHLWLSRPDADSHTESNIAALLSASSYPLPERNDFSATASSVKKRGRPPKDFDSVERLDSKQVGAPVFLLFYKLTLKATSVTNTPRTKGISITERDKCFIFEQEGRSAGNFIATDECGCGLF